MTLDEDYTEGVVDVLFDPTAASGFPSCSALDGLTSGSTLSMSIRSDGDFEQDPEGFGCGGCWEHRANVSLPLGVTVERGTSARRQLVEGGYDLAWLSKRVALAGCTGELYMSFRTYGDPMRPREPDQRPPFRVARALTMDPADGCPPMGRPSDAAVCEDVWVATLEPR